MLTVIGVGLALFAVAAAVDQRWEVTHKGHRIRFQNNPFRGEKLFIDDRLVGRGRLGYHSEIRASIEDGEGIGDRIVATSAAGLTAFSCRILVESPQQAPGTLNGMSNEELLAEVRRRGLARGDE